MRFKLNFCGLLKFATVNRRIKFQNRYRKLVDLKSHLLVDYAKVYQVKADVVGPLNRN